MNDNTSLLGKRLFDFEVSRSAQEKRLIWAGLAGFASLGFLASTVQASPAPGYKFIVDVILLLFITVPLVAAIWFLTQYWKARGKRIELYEHGIIVAAVGSNQIYQWQSFTDIQIRQNYVLGHAVVAAAGDISPAVITLDYVHALELANIVLSRTAEALVAQHLERLQQGYSVSLDHMTLSPEGIQQGTNFVSWSEIQDWQVGSLNLTLRKKSGGVAMIIATPQVRNGFLLPMLLQAMTTPIQSIDVEHSSS